MTTQEVIHFLRLEPLPGEGGWFRETWRSADTCSHPAHGATRPVGTAILYLLGRGERSRLHRLPGVEVYFHQGGACLEMLLLDEPGQPAGRRVILGPIGFPGSQPQVVVPAGAVQGSRVLGEGDWALVGTAMAPGFDFADWAQPELTDLQERYPAWVDLIGVLG